MGFNAPVVVGVDGSPASNSAVAWAANDAVLRDRPLILVTALFEPGMYATPSAIPQSFFDDEETAGKQLLEDALEIAKKSAAGRKLVIDTDVRRGPAVGVMLDHVQTAGMIVLGSRGLGDLHGMLVGSVSSAIACHAPCPVAIIRELPSDQTGAVVVGVDGTACSEPAIGAAFHEASLRGVELVAVHTWTDFSQYTAFAPDNYDTSEDWSSMSASEDVALAESMAGWSEQFPEVTVRRVVAKDRPVSNLLNQSGQLLVVGSRGRGGFAGMLLGSTSRALLHLATGPLMIVRDK